jgi:DNA-binding XRE family transcriptional regulator
MKQIVPNGPRIKKLRLGLERLSTQKEVAHAVRVSERKLRQIENESAPINAGPARSPIFVEHTEISYRYQPSNRIEAGWSEI